MGRIDEALRRARAPLMDIENRQPGSDVFVSVWSDVDASPERHRPVGAKPSVTRSPSSELVLPMASMIRPAPVPTIGGVGAEWREKLATHEGVVNQFRRLAAVLVQAQRSRTLKTIMVTSAVPGEGKTLTALNLALVLSDSYRRRVLLIEADFRRPRISALLNLSVTEGLSDLMKSPEDRKATRVQLAPNLTLLPAGRPDPDPVSGLTSRRMQELLLSAAEEFDWVVMDTPPTSVAADAGLLSELTDGTLLVVRAGQTQNAAVQQAIEAVGRERILGVVLNAADERSSSASLYYYGSVSADVEPASL